MKNLLKIFTILLFSVQLTYGQANDQATMTVIAEVSPEIAINTTRDLDFGTLVSGMDFTIEYTDADAGLFTVTTAEAFRIGFTPPTILSGPSNATLPIALNFYGGDTVIPENASLLNVSISNTDNQDLTTNNNNEYYIFVGGTVDVPAAAPGGVYVGEIIATVEVEI